MTDEEKAEFKKIEQNIEELNSQLKVLYKKWNEIRYKNRKETCFCPKCNSNDLESHYNVCFNWSCNNCKYAW